MKLEDLPDFAKPYKKKGFDVRLCGSAYRLVRISSKRVEGKRYPVLVQEYIGTILPDGSLKRRASLVPPSGIYLEFGLSDFLWQHYKRLLLRSIYGYSTDLLATPLAQLGVLHYVCGTVSDTAIVHCALTVASADTLKPVAKRQRTRIERLSTKIALEQDKLFGEDLADFELLMRLCVVDSASKTKPKYPSAALEILQHHGVKL